MFLLILRSFCFGILFNAYGLATFIGPRLAAVVQQANNGSYAQAFYIEVFVCKVGIIFTVGAMRKANKKMIDMSV